MQKFPYALTGLCKEDFAKKHYLFPTSFCLSSEYAQYLDFKSTTHLSYSCLPHSVGEARGICNKRISSFGPDHCSLKAKKDLPPPPRCGSITHAFPGQSAVHIACPWAPSVLGVRLRPLLWLGFWSGGVERFCPMCQWLSYIWTWNNFSVPDHYRHRAFQECKRFIYIMFL